MNLRRERLLLFTLAALQFTNIMDFMIMMPLGPQLMRLFAITPAQFSVLVSSYTFSAGTTGFLGAFFIDRFDRKKSLTFVYSGFIAGTFACALSPDYVTLVSARILTGAFGGFIMAQVLSIVGDSIPQHRRGRAMGLVMTAFSVASVFGVPFGLTLANMFSWHAPFFFLGIVGLLLLLGMQWAVPEMKGHLGAHENPIQILGAIVGNADQLKALSLTAVLMLGHFAIIPFLSPYMVSNVGFTDQQLTYIYLIGGAATIVTSPLAGRIADRYGLVRVFTVAGLLALIPAWILTHLGRTPVPVVLVITTFFFITGNARMIPAMALVTSTVSPRRRGGFMSINSSVQQWFAGLAALISGMIVFRGADGELHNYNVIAYLTIATTLICVYISHRIRPLPPAEDSLIGTPPMAQDASI